MSTFETEYKLLKKKHGTEYQYNYEISMNTK